MPIDTRQGTAPREGTSVASLVGNTPLVRLRRFRAARRRRDLRQARIPESRRLGEGPRGAGDDRSTASGTACSVRAACCSTRPRATPGSPTRCSARRAAIRVRLCVPANVTRERQRLLRAYGADLVLTDPMDGSDGAIREARRLFADDPGALLLPDQYSNPANWRAHYRHDGAGDHRADGRPTHALRGGSRHERHVRRHRPPAARVARVGAR